MPRLSRHQPDRHFLEIVFESATVTARAFEADIIAGPGRAGPPEFEKIGRSRQVIAQFDFGNKLGIYDFTGDQYFSWIRSHSLLVRGPRGEIRDQEVRPLEALNRPSHFNLLRHDAGQAGNLEGLWHKGYSVGADWVTETPFPTRRSVTMRGDRLGASRDGDLRRRQS